jgi:archaellum component FlaC
MFRTRRVLEEISERLAGMDAQTSGVLAQTSGMLAELKRMNAELKRMNTTMDREFKLTRASVENNTQVTREIVLELREQRPILEHIDHGVEANNKGLMHVLDELRNGRGGPGTAPAT